MNKIVGATPDLPITINDIKPRLKPNKKRMTWDAVFSNMVVVVFFSEEMKPYFDIYESLAAEFVSKGTWDIRCIKVGSRTAKKYCKYPVDGLALRRFFKKYPWEDNLPSRGSMLCVIRLLSDVEYGFGDTWEKLSEHCRQSNIPEYLITPTGQEGEVSNINSRVNVIYWNRPEIAVPD